MTEETAEGESIGENGGERGDAADDTGLGSHEESGQGCSGKQRGGVGPARSAATTAGSRAHVGSNEFGTVAAAEGGNAVRARSHRRRSTRFLPRDGRLDGGAN